MKRRFFYFTFCATLLTSFVMLNPVPEEPHPEKLIIPVVHPPIRFKEPTMEIIIPGLDVELPKIIPIPLSPKEPSGYQEGDVSIA